MIRWLKALGIGILAVLAALAAARATSARRKARAAFSDNEAKLITAIETGTADERQAALKAKQHLDDARRAEKEALAHIAKQGQQDETLETVLDRWRKPRR